tara:strand:- start:22866 stop:25367 length:2502 start_codon:yes stop_codon:yes gene_type:complete
MKQALLSTIFLLVISATSISQVNILWESRFDNNGNDDYSEDIVIDASGNSYVVGTSFNGTQFNVITIKYDVDGNELWNVTHDGPASGLDEAIGLVLDSNGDVIIAGHHQVSGADFDVFLKKLNGANGSTVWTYSHPGTANFDQCADVTIDANDNVIAVGGVDFGAGDIDYLAISVNSAGALNWSDQYFAGSARDFANAVTVDASNNVYVTGESNAGANGLDYYTLKYNSTGGILWNYRHDGNGQDDSPKDIIVAPDGNTYVVGESYRGLIDDDDILLLKISTGGTFVWEQIYGGTDGGEDKPRSLTVDPLNNIYVTGSIKNTGNGEDYYVSRFRPDGTQHWDYVYQSSSNGFDEARGLRINSNYELYVSGYSNLSGSSDDYFTVRLDTVGTEIWTKRFDGPASNSDQMTAFEIDDFGNIFVTGSSSGSGTLRDYSTIKYCQLETIASDDDTICIGESSQLNASGGMNYQWQLVSGDPITAGNFSCTNCPNPVATPDLTSTYAVSSENGSGCIDFDTVVVVVNPLPGPTITPSGPTEFCDGGSVDLTADMAADYDWNTGENSQTITADTAGTYSLTVTDADGCQNSTNVQVTVYAIPEVDGGQDRFRCPGDSVLLGATGADTYTWYSIPNGNVVGQNGDYYVPGNTADIEVLGVSADGCEDRDTITVTLYPNPTQVEITQGMGEYLFVNTNDGDIEWFFNGVNTDSTGTAFLFDTTLYCNGLYEVIYTDENGCQTDDTLTISGEVCEDTSSLVVENQLEQFELFPNPTAGEVQLIFENYADRTILVHSMTGRLVAEMKLTSESASIDLSHVETGSYMITVLSNNGVMKKRIIKK